MLVPVTVGVTASFGAVGAVAATLAVLVPVIRAQGRPCAVRLKGKGRVCAARSTRSEPPWPKCVATCTY